VSGRNGNGSIANLERRLTLLRATNAELLNQQDAKQTRLHNSMMSLAAGLGAGFQTNNPLGSFNNIAQYSVYAPLTINWTELTYMYKTHGLLQTAIDMPVLDALRGGLLLKSNEMDPDDLKALDDRIEHGNVISEMSEAEIWTRLYGGGALVINTDQDPTQPFNPRSIKKGAKLEFYAASRWEVSSTNRFSDYYLFYGQRIHHTRVLTMAGKAAPYLVKFVLQGWGMSEFERMVPDFNIYLRTKDVIYELLKEAKVDVYMFENFTSQLASAQGTQMTRARVQLMNQIKSYSNALVLDKNDEYQQKQLTFAGLAEVHSQNMKYIASALRMPMTKLFGISAAGFNSGEDDIENYNALVESEVRQPMRPMIKTVLELLCMQQFGDVFDIDFDYKPLRILGEVEEEQVKTSKYNRYASMFGQGLMEPQEFAELCHSEGLIPIEPSAAKTGELFENPLHQMGAGEEDDDEGNEKGKKDD
jgi:phage-related protein (TIGR01555 family)